ncbi:nucleotide disphospho-sugar-binding domain-containing protein [Actinokineospora guangxiensis]|uniref:Nucleotide disphospho-sugar-binding domain-containing protein n=1 Tax=Actinokineospora guangxiensis TaxID=1490288 RepID=A0ABW0EMY8_9PSEU
MFAIHPIPAHVYPMIPLAQALQRAGHEVRVMTHQVMAGSVAAAGLTPVCVGDPTVPPLGATRQYPEAAIERLVKATAELDMPDEERQPWDVFAFVMLTTAWEYFPPEVPPEAPRPGVDDMVEFAQQWRPDLVLWDHCAPAGAIAARMCGAAQARFTPWQDYFGWSVDKYLERTGKSLDEHVLAETVRPVAERYGLEVDRDLLLGQWTVDALPDGFRLGSSVKTVLARPHHYSSARSTPDWLREPPTRPRIGMTMGLSLRDLLPEKKVCWTHVPHLLDAVADFDVDVVATLNEVQLSAVDRVPPNVRIVDYAPLEQLVPTCAAMITHGGVSTCVAAVTHRVPQLITDTDELITTRYPGSTATAAYVTSRNAGLRVDIRNPSTEVMRAQIEQVLTDPGIRAGVDRAHEELMAMPGYDEVIPTLQRLTAEHRTR